VERSSESFTPIEKAKSRLSLGVATSSSSPPMLRDSGTLKTSRDEQEPAVTLTWRSLTSM
jgi:hypothetical protein